MSAISSEVSAATPRGAPQTEVAAGALLLETNDLHVRFSIGRDSVAAVAGLSYKVFAGKTLAIVGESGAGKTVSCRALLGLLPESATVTGSAMFMGAELLGQSERDLRARRGRQIAIAFHDASRSLNPTMCVGDQITESICAHERIDRKAARQRVIELLELLRIPAPREHLTAYPHQLSGGMRQRVMLAMAVAANPKLLIADEPTSSLDGVTRVLLVELLRDLQKRLGMGLILVSHDLGLAAKLADDVLVMRAGQMIEYASATEILADPRMSYTKTLFDDVRTSQLPRAATLRAPTGRNDHDASTQFELEARNLSHEYYVRGVRVHAVSDVSFGIRRAEALGLVGETGSGKTTLARALLGIQSPTAGSVLFRGRNMTDRPDARNRDVQAIFQDPFGSLNPKWRVARIVEEPLVGYRIGDREARRRRVEEVLKQVNLPADIAQRRPRQLSGGEAQRVAIARALAPNPAVLVCDEALSSLDAITRREVLRIFSVLRDNGLACLFISHDLAVVQQACDRIAVLHLGQLCEIGPTNALSRAPSHPYTAALVTASMSLHNHGRASRPGSSYLNAREAPSPMDPPSGCRFRTRCVRAAALCASEKPRLHAVGDDHLVACHFPLRRESV